MNIAMLLDLVADVDPERPVVQEGDSVLTAAQLRAAARELASQLAEVGRPGSAIGYVGVASTGVPIALFACAYAGLVFAPVNYRADEDLFRHFWSVLNPAAVLVDARYRDQVAASGVADRLVTTPDFDPSTVYAADVDAPAGYDAAADGAAATIFTSGTTARPKPIRLSHANLTDYVLASTELLPEPVGAASLIAAPPYHIAALTNILTSLYSGRRMVLLDSFSPEEWVATVRSAQVTHAFVVPTMMFRIAQWLATHPQGLPSLETLAYGGGPSDARVVADMLERLPATGFVQAYGLTETSSTITVLGPDDHRAAASSTDPEIADRLRSVGRPVDGVELTVSPESEVLVRGARVVVVPGDPRVDAEGWFHTGDLGRFDAAGYLYLLDRIDDMIIRGGENISPSEVESVLTAQPGVTAAAVVGVPDPEWGQRVMAAVEAEPGLDVAATLRSVRDQLPGFKCPEQLVVVEKLPRTDLGKLQRRRVLRHFDEAAQPC